MAVGNSLDEALMRDIHHPAHKNRTREGAYCFGIALALMVAFWSFVPVPWLSSYIKIVLTLFISVGLGLAIGIRQSRKAQEEHMRLIEEMQENLQAERNKQLSEFRSKQSKGTNA